MPVYPPEFLEALLDGARMAVEFDGDVVALTTRAHDGDPEALDDLVVAYWSIAALLGVRLRPIWLPPPDAAQEAVLVLQHLIEVGSSNIEADLAPAISRTFEALQRPDLE
ncbi:MAG: hypothetical protein ABJA81_03815 [Nocardioidaceae bacterium]